MKKVLLLMVAVLMISSVAMADHIGIYSDASGTSCSIIAGFTSGSTVIHKQTPGTTGSRWYLDASGLAGGIFAFNANYNTVGNYANDLSIAYGQCLAGPLVLGTILMNATGGVIVVKPAQGFTDIIVTACDFGEHPASGGQAFVGVVSTNCLEPLATEQSTWGQVKALYR
jgi:hypothetical protein